ncbi:MAG: penicillin-binding protein 2 [Actinomycetaceae bacterium]|nr:penicillin-binding protein 2 [Actinomycetaceae bacterium]
MKKASAPRRPRGPRVQLMVILGALVAISLSLLWLQIVRGPELAAQGRLVRTYSVNIPAERGSIVDANGAVLAESIATYHIAVNQKHIANARVCENPEADDEDERDCSSVGPAAAAKKLAPILEMDPVELGGLMVGDSTYQYLKKNVSPQVWRQVRALDIFGLEWEAASKRSYPNGSIAAPVLGTLDAEGKGVAGLEATQDEVLAGEDGEESYEIGTTGEVIPGGREVIANSRDGSTVHTTLRLDLQYAIEQTLNAAVERHAADWGAVVVQEISTGKILAMADSGNHEIDHNPQTVRAVQYAVEPGSVGKILTVASALETGAVTPLTPITVPDEYVTEDGQHFLDSHGHPTYVRTVTGVLAESSNTGTVQIGQKIKDQDRYDLFRRVGLGSLTGIPLPGESAGLLATPEEWDGRQKYTTMFGQGYSVTQLQQAGMLSVIGNGGVYQPPRLIEGWTKPDGRYEPAPPAQPVQAISKEVSQTLLTMMESITADSEGTGTSYAVEGYRVASKTGTAELFEGATVIGTGATIAGIIPADNPTAAISVLLYRPRKGSYAAASAGPLFHDVALHTVHHLGIAPSAEKAKLFPTQP